MNTATKVKSPAWGRARGVALAVMSATALIAGSTGVALASTSSPHGNLGGVQRQFRSSQEGDVRGSEVSAPLRHVDEGLGQVMVGPNWLVQAEVSCPIPISVATGNVLLVGVQPSESIGCTTLPIIGSGNSIVWIFESAAQGTGNPVSVVNGFDLYRAAQDHAKGYLVPALGIEILWRGANPAAVISTLGWSPLHYVLSFGGSEPPSFWKRYYFDGVSVAAPPSWPVKEPLVLVCSGPFDHGPVVGLGVHVIPVPCPYMAPPTTPTDGVLVTPTDQIGDCPIRGIMLVAGMESTVCSDPSLQPPELEVKLVFGSGSTTHRVYVTVGLGATAMVARQIIGSLAGIVPVAARVG